jgi:hypothetical protein
MAAWTLPVRAQTWQALPFPSDSSWPGPFGQPAVITNNEIILDGQPVRSVQTFSGPLTINFDVSLDARTTTDGALEMYFIPPGQSLSNSLTNATHFRIVYRNDPTLGPDALYFEQIISATTATPLWGPTPFPVATGTVYHVNMDVSPTGALRLNIDGKAFSLSNTVNVPFGQFQIQLEGWQPDDVWHVTDFTAVPGLVFSFTNAVQTCKSKTKIDGKTMSTNVTTTCTVNINVVASNTGTENTSAFPVLLWAEQGSVFDADVGPLPLARKVKALKPGKSVAIRQKAIFTNDQAGTFFHLTDTNLNVLASVPIE